MTDVSKPLRLRLLRAGRVVERVDIVKWIRTDLAMNTAADSFVLNCLADAIERGDHMGEQPSEV